MDRAKTIVETNSKSDNYSIKSITKGKYIAMLKTNQTVSHSGKILLNKVGWSIRILSITTLISLLMLYYYFGSINPEEKPIMIYTSFVISLSIIVFVFGWIFYRNPSSKITNNPNERIQDSEQDLFSVIIPIYNQREMVEIVIDSVFDSTYKNIELIVVDDGSTDGSGTVLDSLREQKFPQLKVIHKSNGGKRKAVASGFQQSVGKYVILIDSDSIIDRNAIEQFAKVFNSDTKIGAVAGQAKIFNSNENIWTKCQDSWYDYEYNIYKTYESYFGAVTCCSGCLAGYRREAIENVLNNWISDNQKGYQNGPESAFPYFQRKKGRNWIETALLHKINKIFYKLMDSLLSYDDSEDRAMTTYCLMNWKSVYLSTAVAYTEAPANFKSFISQQQRWKKGYLRANLFASTFFWSKKNPLFSLLFYCGLLMTLVAPLVTIMALCYGIFVLNEPLAPISLIGGFIAIGFLEGMDYKMRDSEAENWKYRPLMNLLLSFLISWLIFSAIINYKKNVWLTR